MAADVDLCNLALGHIGDEATISAISPPDGSVQAGQCAKFYPIARDNLLERHTWRFSATRAVLALSPLDPPVGWAFAYACPSNMVKPRSILMPDSLPDLYQYWPTPPWIVTPGGSDTLNVQDYIIESSPLDGTPVLYTNVEDATLIYSVQVTDLTKFTPLARTALARLLAAYLAGPIIKGSTGAQVAKAQLEIFEKIELPLAITSDSNSQQANPYTNATPSPIAARM